MGNVIGGLIVVVIGALIVIKSEWFFKNFGTPRFAEKYLQMYGGGRLFYKLIGIIASIIGFLIMTGLLGGLVIGTFGRLFGSM